MRSLVLGAKDVQWSLIAHDGGDVLPLRVFPCRIGRDPSADVRIAHPTVSVQHAELKQEADGLVVADLSSRNGTFVNGNRIAEPCAIRGGDLVQFGAAVFRLQEQSRSDLCATCESQDVGELALALAQFDKLFQNSSIVPTYQAIVTSETCQPIAYEVLGRSCLFGLAMPGQMFQAAEFLRREQELSEQLRRCGLTNTPPDEQPHLFVNTHPKELVDLKRLIVSLRELRAERPGQPVTLEVHEAAAADISTMKMLRLVLNDLEMNLAYDDFGAGQARLNELVEAEPEYVKFDRKLVHGLHSADARRRQMVKSLVAMCRDLGILTLAEGVENADEAEACHALGFELMQGYYFGRPAPLMQATGTISLPAAAAAGGRGGWNWWWPSK
jgi:EAL domain-containing protein (putative c-di-GMP-specific phosphodiesterase class I)